MAKAQYPSYPDALLEDIKIEHAIEWCSDTGTEKAELYDKYVMMKRLLDISPQDED